MKSEHIIILAIAVTIGYLLYIIMVPFLVPIFWAIILSILFYPLYDWFKQKIRLGETFSSITACSVIIVFLTVPVVFLAAALVDEVLNIYEWIDSYMRESSSRFHDSPIFLLPYIRDFLKEYIDISSLDIKDILLKAMKEISNFIVQNLKGIITNFTGFFLNLILTFFAMFYLFKDGDKFIDGVKELLPLSREEKDAVFKKNRDVIYATLYGGLMVAVAQGTLGGLSFWALGLPSPVFWGTMIAVLSFLPMVGPPVVWIPAAIYLFVKASYIKTIVLVLIGVFVIGLVDNILRPMLVSGRTKMHPLLLLFSILGALKALGFIGIIAGPIILSLSLAIVDIYRVGYLKKSVESEQ